MQGQTERSRDAAQAFGFAARSPAFIINGKMPGSRNEKEDTEAEDFRK